MPCRRDNRPTCGQCLLALPTLPTCWLLSSHTVLGPSAAGVGSSKVAAVCPTHLEHCGLACAHHHTKPPAPGRSVSSRSRPCQESQSARKGTWPATATVTAAVCGLWVTQTTISWRPHRPAAAAHTTHPRWAGPGGSTCWTLHTRRHPLPRSAPCCRPAQPPAGMGRAAATTTTCQAQARGVSPATLSVSPRAPPTVCICLTGLPTSWVCSPTYLLATSILDRRLCGAKPGQSVHTHPH